MYWSCVGGDSILYRSVEIVEYARRMVGPLTNICIIVKFLYYKTCTLPWIGRTECLGSSSLLALVRMVVLSPWYLRNFISSFLSLSLFVAWRCVEGPFRRPCKVRYSHYRKYIWAFIEAIFWQVHKLLRRQTHSYLY